MTLLRRVTIVDDVPKATNVNMQRRKENNKNVREKKKKKKKKKKETYLDSSPGLRRRAPPFPLLIFSPFLNNLPFLSSSFENHAYFHLPFQSPVRHELEDLISIAYLRNILKGKKKKFPSPTALALYSRSSTPTETPGASSLTSET